LSLYDVGCTLTTLTWDAAILSKAYSQDMMYQRSCPVCRSEVLRRVLRDATFLADLGGELNPLTGVASYRCSNGHVFLILEASTVDAPMLAPEIRAL
jgi:hypothetical protein